MKKMISIGIISLFAGITNAQAATFNFTGNIANHNDIVKINFSLLSDATNVRVWTDSFDAPNSSSPGTNFDPITALWNADTGALISQNDDNDTINPSTQTYFDSGFSIASLLAGNYLFTVATFNNFANGTNLTQGFGFDGQTPIAIANWNQPANSGNSRGTFWSVNLDGVDTASPVDPSPNAVPLPGAVWLFGSAIAAFVGFRRKSL